MGKESSKGSRVERESLKPGDHIYAWRIAAIYAHHGIYVGDGKVIHFTSRSQGSLGVCSAASSVRSRRACATCPPLKESYGVVSSCLECFLRGDPLYRFQYSVSTVCYLSQRHGTCSTRDSDPADTVVHHAKELLDRGFGCYDLVTNNCEDFAFYCKTREGGLSGQSRPIFFMKMVFYVVCNKRSLSALGPICFMKMIFDDCYQQGRRGWLRGQLVMLTRREKNLESKWLLCYKKLSQSG